MLILDAIAQQRLPDGTPLDERSLDALTGAAFELVYCTVNGGHYDFAAASVKAALTSPLETAALVEKIAGLVEGQSTPIGQSRLIAAFLGLRNALRDMERFSGHDSAEKLRQFIAPIRDAARILVSVTDDKPMIGEMTILLVSYLQQYRDYGLIPPASLTSAIVQHLRDQYSVDKNRLVAVPYYGNISLSVCPPNVARAVFLEGMKRPELEGIEGWLERTLEISDLADSIAAAARNSNRLSVVMNAALAAYLLYDVVRTSLGWILKRYEKNGVKAPADIYREQQVAEENRAWTGEMLEFSGHRLIATPVTHVATQLLLTGQAPKNDVLRELLRSGTYLIPVYPDVLREAWNGVLDSVYADASGNEMGWSILCEKLEQEMRARFVDIFADKNVASVALRLQEKWWPSRAENPGKQL